MIKKFLPLSLLATVAFSTSLLSHSQAVFLKMRPNVTSSRYVSQSSPQPKVQFISDIPGGQNIVDTVSSSVVSIYGYKNISRRRYSRSQIDTPFFHISFPAPSTVSVQVDAGTGFFVDENGYILTSNHVVADNTAYYIVNLSDGSEKNAQVVLSDPEHDIAILKIDGSGYPAMELADSAAIYKGQAVLAMGNAFGEDSNVTSVGMVSGLHEDIISSDAFSEHTLSDLFETTMQLYPGDSGGPTFDANGRVLGINDAIAVDESNVSFSVPINYAKIDLQKIFKDTR